jgi:hypothetical protein
MMTRRRKFLAGTVAVAATGGIWWSSNFEAARISSGLGQQIDLWLTSSPTLLSLGARLPPPPSASVLAARLRDQLSLPAEGEVDLDAFQQSARKAIARSFAEDELEMVDGWLLAPTELTLGQLAILVSGGRDAEEVRSEPPPWQQGEIATLERWGPQSTKVNQPFNTQADGHSGLWFRFTGAPIGAVIVIDGEEMPTTVLEDIVTSGLFGALQTRMLANPGNYAVELVDPVRRIRQPIGDFVVISEPEKWRDCKESAVFCPVSDWGPNRTIAGSIPNPQPDGSNGLWIKLECAPPEAVVELDGTALPSAHRTGMITTRVDAALYAMPGEYKLELYDPASGERMPIGLLQVMPKPD